jgi:hypothetical protein
MDSKASSQPPAFGFCCNGAFGVDGGLWRLRFRGMSKYLEKGKEL